MTFDEYEHAAMRTAGPTLYEKYALVLSALGLCGESGEFADLCKKMIYHDHPIDTSKLHEELGDILWYIARACSTLGVSLETIAKDNIAKLQRRYPEGFSSERSINREDYSAVGYATMLKADRVNDLQAPAPTAPCPVCHFVGWHAFGCTNKGY